jgi:hypothetical protein
VRRSVPHKPEWEIALFEWGDEVQRLVQVKVLLQAL